MPSRFLVLAALAAVGCGFSPGGGSATGGDGGHTVGDDDAPNADASTIDAPSVPDAFVPDAFVDPDTDQDGISDSQDNCPTVMNHGQENFDHDHFGDACDPCPHLSSLVDNTIDVDTDGDGIGDGCDPRKNQQDTRKLWAPFYPGDTLTGWTVGAGTWAITGGKLTQTSTTASPAYIYAPGTVAHAFVQTSATLRGTGNNTVVVGTSSGTKNNMFGLTQFYACQIAPTGGGTGNSVGASSAWFGMGPQNSTDYHSWGGTFAVNSSFQFTESELDDHNKCTIAQAGTSPVSSTANIGPPDGAVALFTLSAAADFDYLFVVEIGP